MIHRGRDWWNKAGTLRRTLQRYGSEPEVKVGVYGRGKRFMAWGIHRGKDRGI